MGTLNGKEFLECMFVSFSCLAMGIWAAWEMKNPFWLFGVAYTGILIYWAYLKVNFIAYKITHKPSSIRRIPKPSSIRRIP